MSAIAVPFRRLRPPIAVELIAGVLLIDAIVVGSLLAADAPSRTVAMVGVAVLALPCLVYLAFFIRPVYLISAAVFLTMFSGNWRALGFPSMISPDRFFFIAGIGAFVLRDPANGERRPLRFSYVYILIGLAAAYTIASAIGAHNMFNKSDLWPLVDRFGLVPFMLFVIAPAMFATDRDRRILLVTLVVMAAYLGFIAAAEGIGAHALVWPRYLNHNAPVYGLNHVLLSPPQAGRARGPFQDSGANGVSLFMVATACAVAFWTFRQSRWRWLIALIGFVCLFDVIFTLERSVFLGALLGIPLMMLSHRRLRLYLPVVVLLGALIIGGALLASHGLRGKVSDRIGHQQTLWDRYNLDTAAERMFLTKPLTGFGWGQYLTKSVNYFKLAATYPFTAVGEPDHSVVFSNLAELGLIGTGLWALAVLFGIVGAIVRRGPPELVPWRIGLIGVFVMWLTVANFAPLLATFPNQLIWLWAGVAWPLRYGLRAAGVGSAGPTAAITGVPAPPVSGLAWPARQRGAHPTPRQPVAPGGRRRVASRGRVTLALVIVGGLAVLGFLAGQATAGGPAAHPAAAISATPATSATSATSAARPSPTYAQSLDAVMTKLNAIRSSEAARLRSAHDTKTQAQDAQVLAAAHTGAAAAVAALSAGAASTVNATLAHALRDVSSAYASLGQAAARNDGRAYRSAQEAVIRSNESLSTAFGQLRRFGYRLG
jgi:hypothetical protein